jgi:chemotaxis-related protein WspD
MSNSDALDTGGLDLTLADSQAIDDCWNRIGIHGDKSCPLLADHIHCRNCSVYSAAATRLLDRYALQQDAHRPHAAVELGEDVVTRSLLIFRLGEEWLGIATRCLVEVAPLQPIHSLHVDHCGRGWPGGGASG